MPEPGPVRGRLSRETRLLIVTIGVSALVLLLLARLRFPEPPPIENVAAPPLERLAARATYDELARSVARLETTIAPSLIVLRIAPRVESTPRLLADVLSPPAHDDGSGRHVPALRVSGTTAVAAIPPDARIAGIVVPADPGGTAGIIAVDAVQRLALVRVPSAPARTVQPAALQQLPTPVYLVAVEGTRAGVTLRPVFVGRSDRFADPRWTRPLLPLGGASAISGSLMFALDGQFVGVVTPEGSTPAIAGAQDVLGTVERLMARPPAPPGDLGISVQPMTPALAAATRAPAGVVVAEVREDGPARGVLQPGDVITALDGEAIDLPDRLLLEVARRSPGTPVKLSVSRGGRLRAEELIVAPAAALDAPPDDGFAEMRFVRGAGTLLAGVPPGGRAAAAGLMEGDVVVGMGSVRAPTPAQLRAALDDAEPGSHLLLTVVRDGRQRVVAIPVPVRVNVPSADAPR
jgi:S1-C subfamily serine protease